MQVCYFEISFLGYVIGRGEIKMDQKKVEAIIDCPSLTDVGQLRSFLGLANYCIWFIVTIPSLPIH